MLLLFEKYRTRNDDEAKSKEIMAHWSPRNCMERLWSSLPDCVKGVVFFWKKYENNIDNSSSGSGTMSIDTKVLLMMSEETYLNSFR